MKNINFDELEKLLRKMIETCNTCGITNGFLPTLISTFKQSKYGNVDLPHDFESTLCTENKGVESLKAKLIKREIPFEKLNRPYGF